MATPPQRRQSTGMRGLRQVVHRAQREAAKAGGQMVVAPVTAWTVNGVPEHYRLTEAGLRAAVGTTEGAPRRKPV
jgi:hypothetical protein